MKKEKTTQFLMKPKVDFCFKELMEMKRGATHFWRRYLELIWEKSLRAGFCRPICARRIKMISWEFWMYGFC